MKRISPEVREVKAVTMDEYSAILERTANTRYGALIAFSASVAVRRGEALALQWADINWDARQVKISKSLSDTPDEETGEKKFRTRKHEGQENAQPKSSKQTLLLLGEHKLVIDQEREMFGPDYQDNDLVFPQADGGYQQPKQVSKRVAEFMQKAGVKSPLHSMRHMHASILLQNRTPVKIVSERLGHADVMITLRTYAHTMPGDDAAAADTWDSATKR